MSDESSKPTNQQSTIEHVVSVDGRGLFSGNPVHVSMHPAAPNTGVVFVRQVDGQDVRIPATVDRVVKAEHRTALREEQTRVETVEHCLAALAGLAIDNVEIRVDADELPGFDGSSARWCDTLIPAGRTVQDVPRTPFKITEPVIVQQDGLSLVALPDDTPGLSVVYELDYGPNSGIGRQLATFQLRDGVGREPFANELATARSFTTLPEAQAMQKMGFGLHLTPQDFLVIGPDGPIDNALRFPDECARHKILDLIGDLYLFGGPVQGRIIAKKTGHTHNHQLVRELQALRQRNRMAATLTARPKLDTRQIMRILPHRFPMLMVDRVVEFEEDRRAVGIKNVSMNELHFLGHYPGQPIMPGVLILEAMAQLGGLLLSRRLEHTGKLAVLLSMDGVKLRKPVLPGDQLVLTAETVSVRSRLGHVRCQAHVTDQLCAEAEIKFMLVDADPI